MSRARLKPWMRAASALAQVACAACAGPLSPGEAAFRGGDYPRANSELVALEDRAHAWTSGQRAEYALYRGLTLAALGDVPRAEPWLEQAMGLEDESPGSLSPDDARRLETAWQAWCAGCTPAPGP
jgi:hypothetical protein